MLLVVHNIGCLRMRWAYLVNIHKPFYLSDLPGIGQDVGCWLDSHVGRLQRITEASSGLYEAITVKCNCNVK